MKFLIVLATVVACAYAKPGFYSAHPFGYSAGHFGLPVSTYASTLPVATYSAGYSPIATYAATPYTHTVPAVAAAVPAYTKTQYHSQNEIGEATYGYAYPGQSSAAVRDATGAVRGSYAYLNPEGQEIRVNYVADSQGYRAESNAIPVGPLPVAETPEVIESRAAHALAHEEVKARSLRKKRGVTYAAAVAAPLTYSAYHVGAPLAYSAAPIHTAYAAPLTYSAYHAGAPIAYSGVPTAYASPVAYTAAIAPAAVREATLTKVHNNPGHAVSYRVD